MILNKCTLKIMGNQLLAEPLKNFSKHVPNKTEDQNFIQHPVILILSTLNIYTFVISDTVVHSYRNRHSWNDSP